MNQRLEYYDPSRRTLRWWHALFDFMLNISMANAYILAGSREAEHSTELQFRLALCTRQLSVFSQFGVRQATECHDGVLKLH